MADLINVSALMRGGGRIFDNVTGQYLPVVFNRGLLQSRLRTLTNGTGANQANRFHASRRTLAGTTFDLLDLAGGLTDYKGAAITFTALKWVFIQIIDADGTKALRVGPQGQANPFLGGWGGTVAAVYQTIYTDWEDWRPITGHTVTAGTGDIYPVYNPGGSSVTYALVVAGVG